MMTHVRYSRQRHEFLRAVALDDVGWSSEYRRRGEITSWRLWTDEWSYVIVTGLGEPLHEAGLIEKTHAPHDFSKGSAFLTEAGIELLRRWNRRRIT